MRSIKWRIFVMGWLVLGILASCTDDGEDALNDPSNQMVVEAYVYANEPIQHVRLSKVHSGGAALPIPVNTANVKIVQSGQVYELHQVDTIPGMYVQADGSEGVINGIDPVNLNIDHEGRQISAQAEMPVQVTGIALSDTMVHVSPGDEDSILAVLSWDPIENVRYVLAIRNIDENTDLISFIDYQDLDNPFLSVVDHHEIELKGAHFRHYGRHEIYVSSITPAYELFYNQFTGLANAPSNISGGLGIFTAFNGASVTLYVQ